MLRNLLAYLMLFSGLVSVTGQEVVTGLYSNIKIKNAWAKKDKKKGVAAADTLELPFFDDFSQSDIFPDPTRWQDDYVFINNTYSVKQRTQGVATFDALDNTGTLYPAASSYGFEADHLTSQPINLNYGPSDSIYLSFLYEPGGLGDMPELNDSLTLQFYAPGENTWYSVWRTTDIYVDTFKAAIILIDDPRYLLKGFQFRFINYASLSQSTGDPSMMGNCDQWNVDYILLGKNRNHADTLAADVALTKPVRSVLKNYEAMPWKQFRQFFLSEMGPYININYFNNDTIVRNVTRNFEIFDEYKDSLVYAFSGGAANISPLSGISYKGNLIYTFNTDNPDSALFMIKSYLTTDIFDPKQNDTIIYYQKFGNYYAFDDGTAEAGYGVNGQGSQNAMVAYRYSVLAPDTLRAIQICFNESYQDANYTTFNLMVWDDNSGLPGNAIRTQQGMSVGQGPGLNGFRTYVLTDPIQVNGDYYVGWQQTTATFLNAGFDVNTPNAGRQFYFLNGDWNESQAKGSVMIRPVFGPKITSTGIADVKAGPAKLKFWPNPSADFITVENTDEEIMNNPVVVVTDLQGRELIRTLNTGKIDISSLSPGMYIIIEYSGNKPSGFGRLIKSR
jgi:Secretion system C-terminal sorting domain